MKINWFGITYYKGIISRNNTFKRPVRRAFNMWLKHDILDKITGECWFDGTDKYHAFRWNKKKVWKKYCVDTLKNTDIQFSYNKPGWISLTK